MSWPVHVVTDLFNSQALFSLSTSSLRREAARCQRDHRIVKFTVPYSNKVLYCFTHVELRDGSARSTLDSIARVMLAHFVESTTDNTLGPEFTSRITLETGGCCQ